MPDPIKSQIMSAINATNDPAMKTVLLLLLQVLDQIGGKIDAVLADEKSIRELVLSSHVDVHESDHDWIAAQRSKSAEYAEHCRWVSEQRRKEAEVKLSKRKISESLLEKIIWAALAAAVTWFAK